MLFSNLLSMWQVLTTDRLKITMPLCTKFGYNMGDGQTDNAVRHSDHIRINYDRSITSSSRTYIPRAKLNIAFHVL